MRYTTFPGWPGIYDFRYTTFPGRPEIYDFRYTTFPEALLCFTFIQENLMFPGKTFSWWAGAKMILFPRIRA